MEHAITMTQWLKREGIETDVQLVKFLGEDPEKCPALCTERCIVKPDECCEHGCKSVALAMEIL